MSVSPHAASINIHTKGGGTIRYEIIRNGKNFGFKIETGDETVYWCGSCVTQAELEQKPQKFVKKQYGQIAKSIWINVGELFDLD